MTHDTHRPGFAARIWQFFIEASEAAVAVHYRAPWRHAPARAVARRR